MIWHSNTYFKSHKWKTKQNLCFHHKISFQPQKHFLSRSKLSQLVKLKVYLTGKLREYKGPGKEATFGNAEYEITDHYFNILESKSSLELYNTSFVEILIKSNLLTQMEVSWE